MESVVSKELPGLRKEPLFGHRERLYIPESPEAQPTASSEKKEEEVKPVRAVKPKKVKEVVEKPPATDPPAWTDSEVAMSRTAALASTGFELLGIASLTVGGFLVAQWLGFMILGALLIVLGVATGYGP